MDCSPQAPVSMGFSRQEYWSGLPYPPPGDLADPRIEPSVLCLLNWQAGSLPLERPGKPDFKHTALPVRIQIHVLLLSNFHFHGH